MDKKIGKNVLMAATLFSWYVGYASPNLSVSLRVTDHEGYPLKEAGVGVPFIVQVEVINDGTKEFPRPQLVLPTHMQLTQLGTTNSVRTVNNDTVSKRMYQYSAVCQDEGEFIIGPATIMLPGNKELTSNTIRIKASPQQKRAQSQEQQAFIELAAATVTPYVGQAVPVTLRFYYASDQVHLDQLQEPSFKGCKADALHGPKQGHATVQGREYGYLEWKTTLYPEKAGKLVIPAVTAHISVPVKHQRGQMIDMFAMVNQMLGAGRQQELVSNALTISVQPLPQGGLKTQAIGYFSSFNAKLLSDKAQAGEGITFALELVGQGNFSMIGHPNLNLPDGLKYYDSHAKQHQLSETMVKKDFEYILQGLQPGTYTIPPQLFTYFDTKTKSYKTIQSRPVKLTIEGESKEQTTSVADASQDSNVQVGASGLITLERTLQGGGSGKFRSIPWLWFGGVTALFFLFILVWLTQRAWRAYRQKNATYYTSKKAFQEARKQLKIAKKNKNAADVYHVFKRLFSDRLGFSDLEISEVAIESVLKNAGFSEAQISAWRIFFAHTLAVTFSMVPESDDMYAQAEQWLTLLEQMI